MMYVRRSLLVITASIATLVVWAGTAFGGGNPYPPTSDDPDRTTTTASTLVPVTGGAAQADQGALAFTGSDRTLLWVGLAVLVIGVALFVSTRRRAELRRQSAIRGL
jgi:hypothetical protein